MYYLQLLDVLYNVCMQVQQDVSLRRYCTIRLGGSAKYFVEIKNKDELVDALEFANKNRLRHLVIGDGANIVFMDDGFDGIVIKNSILGFDVIEENDISKTIKVGAGENWDNVVKKTCDMSLSGIEALSAIPGTAGAAPVQNIGAYGQELADTFIDLEAYDTKTKEFVTLEKVDCDFGYRTSIFKASEIGRYIIISITIRLTTKTMKPPFYNSLQKYLDENSINDFRPSNIRTAVTEIRKSKLPDPKLIANSGSFFQNPIVDKTQAAELLAKFSEIPQYPTKDGKVKIPAGWLIENAGLKGMHSKHFATYNLHALVITHDGHGNSKELEEFIAQIRDKVKSKFDINLSPEPQLIS